MRVGAEDRDLQANGTLLYGASGTTPPWAPSSSSTT